MIQGVIFDMDGLMFDTERIWATLWEPALAGLGLSYKEGLDEAARGTAGDSMRAVLRRFYGPDCDPDRIIEALHEQGVIAFQAPPPKKPGLDEILAWLEQRHIPMVVASSSRMASIRHHLDGWGLTHYFKAVISGEQFISSKPDPEIFYRAAEFSSFYQDTFLSHFPQGHPVANIPDTPHLILGGGTGFLSKTVGYPYLKDDYAAALKWTQRILQTQHGRHEADISLGVSPHRARYVTYAGKRYPAGFCEVNIL